MAFMVKVLSFTVSSLSKIRLHLLQMAAYVQMIKTNIKKLSSLFLAMKAGPVSAVFSA